jgi:hypothetical protein
MRTRRARGCGQSCSVGMVHSSPMPLWRGRVTMEATLSGSAHRRGRSSPCAPVEACFRWTDVCVRLEIGFRQSSFAVYEKADQALRLPRPSHGRSRAWPATNFGLAGPPPSELRHLPILNANRHARRGTCQESGPTAACLQRGPRLAA